MKKKRNTAGAEPISANDTVAPARSAEFQQLLHLAAQHGIDQAALCRLLWLLNAHPRLMGHQRCLENLGSLLSTTDFVDPLDRWASEWIEDIPAWQSICNWARQLDHHSGDGLEEFFRQPRTGRHHLLMRHGINRHPGAGAIWIRHHDDPIAASATATLKATSRAFRLLQWHLFCSQAEARYDSSSLDQFMHYDQPGEWPAWPRPAAAIGLALRDFSYHRWDTLMLNLPQDTELDAFAAALVDDKDALLEPYDSDEARQRVTALISYFQSILAMLEGRLEERRRGGGGGRGGSRRGIPGFIHFTMSPQVFFDPPEPDSEDEDIPSRNFTRVHFHTDEISPAVNAELEGQDIAPGEDLHPVMDLFPADSRPGGICSLWAARQAIESAAQDHFWDKSQLTPVELAALLDAIDLLPCSPAGVGSPGRKSEPCLLLRTMLLLGCPLEEARTIRVMTVASFAEAVRAGQPASTRLLLVSADGNACVGFAIPAISPRYRAPPKAALVANSHAAHAYLTLPDSTHLGSSLLAHKRSHSTDVEGAVFQEPALAMEAAAKLLLHAVNHKLDPDSRPRVTLTKVQRKLPSLLGRYGLEEVGVALICGDRRYVSEARLHYTQHPAERLAQAYSKAVRRLLAEGGHVGELRSTQDLPRCSIASSDMVGARLIVRHDDLYRLVAELREVIGTRPRQLRSAYHSYHRAFLLYTLLMQSLATGIRPSSDPDMIASQISQHSPLSNRYATIVSVVEKDSQYQSRARAVGIPKRLQDQLGHLRAHAREAWRWQPTDLVLPKGSAAQSMFLDWSDDDAVPRATVVRPQWIADQLHSQGMSAAANFHRGYLRSQLLSQGCPEEVINTFLGHAPKGQSLHNLHASFDVDHHVREITAHLERIANDLGLMPLPSLLADDWSDVPDDYRRPPK
jgi:hypothetical protein